MHNDDYDDDLDLEIVKEEEKVHQVLFVLLLLLADFIQ